MARGSRKDSKGTDQMSVSVSSTVVSDELLTPEQLAKRWHMSPGTLQNWRTQSRGPAYLRIGGEKAGSILYRLQDVIEYESSRVSKPRQR